MAAELPKTSLLQAAAPAEAAPAPQAIERESPRPMCATDDGARAWAEVWHAQYVPSAHDASLYHSVDELLKQLEPGADGSPPPVRLIKLSFLEEWARTRRGVQLPRRQLLERDHPEAFLSAAEVRALPRGFDQDEEDRPLRVVPISHGWLTPQHPDPRGEQLARFVRQVRSERRLCPGGPIDTCLAAASWLSLLAEPSFRADARAAPMVALALVACCPCLIGASEGCVCCCVPVNGQGCCRSSKAFPAGEAAVFYDYASLHQKDEHGERTPAEAAAFGAALDKMGSWYGHRLSTTFSMSVLPEGWGATPYADRGWTTFERAVSALVKPSSLQSWRRLADPAVARKADRRAGRYREPPMEPREFAARLARKVFTNGKSDCELVAGLYADTLAGALGGAENLEFRSCGWGDEEVERLAAVLHLAKRAQGLYLDSNPRIGARGLGALAARLREGAAPRLRAIFLSQWDGGVAAELRAACEGRGIMLAAVF